ncbi:hypothetical protein C3Z09_07305 [Lelliottia aquatilis]|uniref:helix-turn-helix domain-containing protein n=1 Tax=Lelliottia aquatilis TaxID=2080838 RepID=UPI000CDE97C2|nr:helix-turn-helix domain-containing protein [Lelliottia aquatilis]POZ17531.1 hypothetical protein C3Z09_07305 [Lelliottia aquatilis]
MNKIAITANLYKHKPIKPLDIINKLINCFSKHSQPLLGRYGDDRIPFIDDDGKSIVTLITSGQVDIWRNHDNLLVATVIAPGILGLQGSDFRYHTHTFRRQGLSDILYLTHEAAMKIINENNLASDVMTYQAYIGDHQSYRDIVMVNSSTYSIVCMMLTELAQHPNHAEMSVEKYILTRTRLARSGVMKILSDLRYGGFIEMEKGKLIKLGIPFPKNY